MIKTCPLCGREFECLHDEIMADIKHGIKPARRCQCMDITLSEEARKMLSAKFPSQCLCIGCLRQTEKTTR